MAVAANPVTSSAPPKVQFKPPRLLTQNRTTYLLCATCGHFHPEAQFRHAGREIVSAVCLHCLPAEMDLEGTPLTHPDMDALDLRDPRPEVGAETKWCPDCQFTRPSIYFRLDRKNKLHGLTTYCIPHDDQRAQWYGLRARSRRTGEEVPDYVPMRIMPTPGLVGEPALEAQQAQVETITILEPQPDDARGFDLERVEDLVAASESLTQAAQDRTPDDQGWVGPSDDDGAVYETLRGRVEEAIGAANATAARLHALVGIVAGDDAIVGAVEPDETLMARMTHLEERLQRLADSDQDRTQSVAALWRTVGGVAPEDGAQSVQDRLSSVDALLRQHINAPVHDAEAVEALARARAAQGQAGSAQAEVARIHARLATLTVIEDLLTALAPRLDRLMEMGTPAAPVAGGVQGAARDGVAGVLEALLQRVRAWNP